MAEAASPENPRAGKPHADKPRVDKWLWRARFFKTRGLAAELAGSGRLRINSEHVAKPAQPVRPDDVLTFPQGDRIRVIRIKALGTRRGRPGFGATPSRSGSRRARRGPLSVGPPLPWPEAPCFLSPSALRWRGPPGPGVDRWRGRWRSLKV